MVSKVLSPGLSQYKYTTTTAATNTKIYNYYNFYYPWIYINDTMLLLLLIYNYYNWYYR